MFEISENEIKKRWSPNKDVMVSICCITYNHEKFIKQTLDSFLMQQTTFPFEIVIHDDASTDNTANIIREYTEKYPAIFNPLLQTENQRSKYKSGMNPRFNFPRCKGKYIALCEGDDYWVDPLKLKKQVDFLEDNPDFNICFHNTSKWKDGQLSGIKSYPPTRKQNITFIDLLKGDYVETCSGVFRFNRENHTTLKEVMGDSVLFLSCLENDKKGHYINEDMAVYRIHEGGVWSLTPKLNKLLAGSQINEYFLRTYPKKEYVAIVNHQLKKISIEISILYLRAKNFNEFLNWQKKAATFYSAKKIGLYYAVVRKYFINKNLFKKTINK